MTAAVPNEPGAENEQQVRRTRAAIIAEHLRGLVDLLPRVAAQLEFLRKHDLVFEREKVGV